MRKERAPTAATEDATRASVRERYAGIATGNGCGCGGTTSSCCDGEDSSGCCGDPRAPTPSGYSAKDLSAHPEGADLGLGCGHPTALVSIRPGQRVLDLGSGAGVDCFLASKKVGTSGRVIGVDMTPEMLEKARSNARGGGYRNVEFRLGEIEHLPVADEDVDLVISNCVINLALDKKAVYREAFRVLRPGGQLAISDVVATRPISAKDRADPTLWSSCSSGALQLVEVKRILKGVGFTDVQVDLKGSGSDSPSLKGQSSLGVYSADIRAKKPRK